MRETTCETTVFCKQCHENGLCWCLTICSCLKHNAKGKLSCNKHAQKQVELPMGNAFISS